MGRTVSLAERNGEGSRPVDSRRVRWSAVHIEQSALVRRDSLAYPRKRWNRLGSFEAVDVALKFCAGEAAAAADVDGTQFAGLHEGVDGCSADQEKFGGFLRCQ